MKRLFDVLEEPVLNNKVWYLRKIKQHLPVGEETFVWTVQLAKRDTGIQVEFTHADLYVAWARATEAACSHELGLDQLEGEGQSLS